jgi:O-acetylserine/cysteine efflux transporter
MSFRYILFAILVALIWGVNFVVMKVGLLRLDPFLFGFLRFFIVLIILLPWLKIVQGAMFKLFILGNLIGGFQFALIFLGMDMTEHVSAMAVIVQMNIPMTLIMAHFILKERMSYWRTSGVVIAFVGVLIITLDPEIMDEGIVILIILSATAFYSIGVILMRRMTDIPVFQTQAWIAFYSVPVFIIMTLIYEENQIGQLVNIDMDGILAVFYTSILSTIVGYGGMNFLIKKYPITLISPILMMVPVFATGSAVLFLGEIISLKFIIGSLVTLCGLGVINYRDWQLKRKARIIL